MPSYSTPGVYVNETLLSSLTSTTSGPTAAVFFGEAERGPATPTIINDWSTYKSLYGELTNQFDLGYAVYHYFSNGGRSCYVQRVINSTAAAATYASFPYYPTGVLNASAGMFTVSALSAGTWGNTLTAQVLTGTVPSTSTTYGSFTLVISLGGVEMERWIDISLDPGSNRYAPAVVNTYSRFIRLSSVDSAAASGGTAYYTIGSLALDGGSQAAVINTDFTDTFPNLDLIEGNLLLNAVGQTDSTIVSTLVTKAAERGDSFVIIDPSATDTTVPEIQSTAANFAGVSDPGYAAHYAPMLIMIDPGKTGPGAVRTTYPGGAVAGLYVRTEVERTVAKAPAGHFADIRGALGIGIKLSEAQIGTLYDGTAQINTFKTVTGAGVISFGARTLNRTQPDKFVSVRRTLNYLKFSLKQLGSSAIFEPNNELLWNKLTMGISGFLSDFWRAGGLKGARANDAFFVVCDGTNNTAVSIDQGIVNVQVGVALQTPAEFIVINISQWTGGSNAVETI